jgi:hypothetical protein
MEGRDWSNYGRQETREEVSCVDDDERCARETINICRERTSVIATSRDSLRGRKTREESDRAE